MRKNRVRRAHHSTLSTGMGKYSKEFIGIIDAHSDGHLWCISLFPGSIASSIPVDPKGHELIFKFLFYMMPYTVI